jgi:hypothetical protein
VYTIGVSKKTDNPNTAAQQLIELANYYPSPHNGQPIELAMDGNKLEVFFVRERGLKSADVSYTFSFTSMGIFIEHLRLCAQALGHTISVDLELPDVSALKGSGSVIFAKCSISWNSQQPDTELQKAIHFRQTSRKKYTKGLDDTTIDDMLKLTKNHHMKLVPLSPEASRKTVWLNQRAVFDDMFDTSVRQELAHWLRYTEDQKNQTQDGLSYDCMELNGKLLEFTVKHYKILHMPVLSWLLKQYYMHTMKDSSSVFYMLSPFADEHDAYKVGETIMQLWMGLSKAGYYIHPFGTIMSNPQAHADFMKLVGITNESVDNSYLTFIFRAGESPQPARSLRIPPAKHLMKETT